MSSGKFNTWGPDGHTGCLRLSSHKFPYQIIVPGLIDGGNNFNHPVTHHWPAELTYKIRPMYKEYRINNDLTWTEFTARNTRLEPYVTITNPCCEVEKDNGKSTVFLLTSFDNVSRAFISNGEIHNKVVAIYLSSTRTNGNYYAWRDSMIFTNPEVIAKANELGLMVGIPSFISNFSGPSYRFSVIQNPHLWDSSVSFR